MKVASPSALIFDLDGTLLDSAPSIASALGDAFESAGFERPTCDIRSWIGPPIRVIARCIKPELNDDQTVAIELAYRHAYDDRAWRDAPLFPNVKSTLVTLHAAGYRLFLATNKPSQPTRRILAHYDLGSVFEDVQSRDSVTPPHSGKAAMLGHILTQWKLDSLSTLMVGDSAEDHQAALDHSLSFVFARYGYGEARDAEHAIDHFEDLLETLAVNG